MDKIDIEKYRNLLLKYVDNTDGSEDVNELCEIFFNEIHEIGNDEAINELMPILKYFLKTNLNNFDNVDVYGVTENLELFRYFLSFSDKIDVIELMRRNEDGEENLINIIELMYKNKLTIPTKLINKHFTDENLKWCGWYENAGELRNSLCSKMTTLNLYYNKTFSYEGDMTEYYFRKNDILIIDNKNITSLNYDLEKNELSEKELKYLWEASDNYFEDEYSSELILFSNNGKIEKIQEIKYKNYNNFTASDIEMKKTIYKVNKKHLMIVDKGDVNIVTTITNIYN